MRSLLIIAVLFCAPLLSGCGFTPVYATGGAGGEATLRDVRLAGVTASETATPILTRAIERRTALDSESVRYDLFVTVSEAAVPLAVQIDDSVTRYNYSLGAQYVLRERSTGAETKGSAGALASFNVVSTQYSTLYAERAAREKAARALVEEIERDILLKFASNETTAAK
ncbi:MAG: hypothetical protein AB7P23_11040 [Amphiplicatus sp.]